MDNGVGVCMSLLTDLTTAITAIVGLTGVDGHLYKAKEGYGVVLVTILPPNTLIEGIDSDEIERPFQLKLYAKDEATQITFEAAMQAALNKAITNGFWKIYPGEPDYTESRKNLVILGKQVKVE